MNSTYVFGGDIGRTRVALSLVSEHALTLGTRSEKRESDLVGTLERLASSLLREHRVARVELTVLGVAGCWSEPERREVASEFRHARHLRQVRVVSDALVALYAALSGRPGIVVIAGTGAIALGRDLEGNLTRASGYGHVLGDEGSGFWLGREGLLAGLRALENRGRDTVLSRLLETEEPEEARSRVLELARGAPSAVAELAPRVIEAARDGDEVARTLVEDATGELALTCASVSKRGRFGENPEVRTSGGLFRSRFFYELFRAKTLRAVEGARVAPSERPPAYGAALMALEELGFIRSGRLR